VNYCATASGDNVSFTVQSLCSNGGLGALSSPYSFTYAAPVPVLPTNLGATPISPTSELLSWNSQPGVSFTASYYGGTTGGFSIPSSTNSLTTYTLTGLASNSNYTYYLTAFTPCSANGQASFSFTTLPPANCNAPSSPWFQSNTGSVTLNWGAVTGATSYDIQYTVYPQAGGSTSGTVPSATNSYTFTHSIASSGSEIVASVRAHCSNGNISSWSSSANTTQNSAVNLQNGVIIDNEDDPNGAPVFKMFPVPSSSQVNILWNAKESGKSEIMLSNALGITLMKISVTKMAGINSYSLNIGQLTNGVYFLKLIQGNEIHVKKLVVQK
jgi:hypothetical protein